MKKAPEILRRHERHFFRIQVSHSRERSCHFDDVGWLVALPAQRLRRQKRRICFRENAIEGQIASAVAKRLHFRIRDIGGERNEEAHFDSPPRILRTSRETMENSAETARTPFRLENLEAVGPRIPAMNHDRKLSRLCDRQL